MSNIAYTIRGQERNYVVEISKDISNYFPRVVESAKRSIATFLAQYSIDLMELYDKSTEINTHNTILVSLGINNLWPIIYMEPPENYIIDSVWPKQTLGIDPYDSSSITRDDSNEDHTIFEIEDETVSIHVWYHPESLRPI